MNAEILKMMLTNSAQLNNLSIGQNEIEILDRTILNVPMYKVTVTRELAESYYSIVSFYLYGGPMTFNIFVTDIVVYELNSGHSEALTSSQIPESLAEFKQVTARNLANVVITGRAISE